MADRPGRVVRRKLHAGRGHGLRQIEHFHQSTDIFHVGHHHVIDLRLQERRKALLADVLLASGKPHAVTIDASASSITAGIVRSDNLGQDDPDDTTKQTAEVAPQIEVATNAQQAAWAALVQSLFGSAEFQFAR